jgi:hypothetical protein
VHEAGTRAPGQRSAEQLWLASVTSIAVTRGIERQGRAPWSPDDTAGPRHGQRASAGARCGAPCAIGSAFPGAAPCRRRWPVATPRIAAGLDVEGPALCRCGCRTSALPLRQLGVRARAASACRDALAKGRPRFPDREPCRVPGRSPSSVLGLSNAGRSPRPMDVPVGHGHDPHSAKGQLPEIVRS